MYLYIASSPIEHNCSPASFVNPPNIHNHDYSILFLFLCHSLIGIMEYATSEIFESSSSSAHMGLHKDKATSTINEVTN